MHMGIVPQSSNVPSGPRSRTGSSRIASTFEGSRGSTSKHPILLRQEGREAIVVEAEDVLTDLYTEGFLDPANWEQGSYADAFGGFARGARDQAETHPGPLTAGPGAGDRYERIEPKSGRITTRRCVERS